MTPSRLIKALAAISLCVVLANCARPVTALQDVPAEQHRALAFTQLDVRYDPALEGQKGLESDELLAAMSKHFNAATAARSTTENPTPTIVDIEILSYREASTAGALILGDTAEISGYVRLRDVASGAQVGEYYVTVVAGEADIIGLATALTNESELSSQFIGKFFKYFDAAPGGAKSSR